MLRLSAVNLLLIDFDEDDCPGAGQRYARAIPEASWSNVTALAVVMSQEGFPSTGVWRVRDVEAQAAQWKVGGAPADTNHTRILDVAWPADARPAQFDFLSRYPASKETNMDKLGPDDFPQIPLLRAK